jgi:dsRNA-specific ribonuclease
MGCNDRLEKTCKQLHFDAFVLTTPLARGQWIPSQLELFKPGECEIKGVTSRNPSAGKVYADVMESLLGLIFLNYGYDMALEVADELRLTLPWHIKSDKSSQFKIAPKPKLLAAAARYTGHASFSRPELVEEAFTHSSALHPEVASYQRLEWAGDAVLCLTVRERIYKQFTDILLGDMVVMEAALVANETLAYISVKNGLPKLINHRDQSLPGRIESYDWSVKELGRGLWGTGKTVYNFLHKQSIPTFQPPLAVLDPPKVISDVVESLIGAVYLDAGFACGRAAVTKLLDPVFQYLSRPRDAFDDLPLKHPKKVMQEIGGNLLAIISYNESELAAMKKEQREKTLVWHGSGWRKLDPKSQNYVAGIQFVGNDLILVSDISPVVARSRACAFVVCMLEQAPDLLERLKTVNSFVERSNMMLSRNDDADDEDDDIDDILPV